MARWDEPTFMGAAGKIGSLALQGREGWGLSVPSATKTVPVFAIRSAPHGSSQIHHVNALDPGSAGYLLPDKDPGALVPAGRY